MKHRIPDVVRAAIADGADRLAQHDPGVREGVDAEAVHQARVATRRLRSDLKTFRPLLDEVWAKELRAELGWLAGLLGAVRDADVLLEHLRADVATLPLADRRGGDELVATLEKQRTAKYAALCAAMDSVRYADLRAALEAPARMVQKAPVVKKADTLVKGPWKHLRHAVDELGDEPADDQLHQVRIRAKRCRYAAEAVAPAVGKPAATFAGAVAVLQDTLGDVHDAAVLEDWLRAAVSRGPARQALAAGELIARAQDRAAARRRRWRQDWRRAKKSWMR